MKVRNYWGAIQAADRALAIEPGHAEAKTTREEAVIGIAKLAEELANPAISPALPPDPPLGN